LVLNKVQEKPGQKPGFSVKSKEAVSKTEVLEQPQLKDYLRRFQNVIF
jgi:hypothetical protein